MSSWEQGGFDAKTWKDFNDRLECGLQGENVVDKYMVELGYGVESKGETSDYDRVYSAKTKLNLVKSTSFEIKTDFKAANTFNLAIEFASNGLPSGISITKADYQCFIIPSATTKDHQIIIISTEQLKQLIIEHKQDRVSTYNRTGFYLFDKQTIIDNGKKTDTITRKGNHITKYVG